MVSIEVVVTGYTVMPVPYFLRKQAIILRKVFILHGLPVTDSSMCNIEVILQWGFIKDNLSCHSDSYYYNYNNYNKKNDCSYKRG